MFMNGSMFDDDVPSRGHKEAKTDRNVSDAVEVLNLDERSAEMPIHPNSLLGVDDLEGEIGGVEYLSGARSSVIQQQRELQKKKLQERMGGGVVRTSLPKQYSAPRSMNVDERLSRFGHDDDELDEPSTSRVRPTRQHANNLDREGGSKLSRHSRDDDNNDDDFRQPSRADGLRDWDKDNDGGRGRGYGRGQERDRGSNMRGRVQNYGRDLERDRVSNPRDRGAREDQSYSRDYAEERGRGRARHNDNEGPDQDRSRTPKGTRNDPRRSNDYDDLPSSDSKRGSTNSGRKHDDEENRRGDSGRGYTHNAKARGRSRSRSHSHSRSRSQSRSASDASSDDGRNGNAAALHDRFSNSHDGNKVRAAANVRKPKLDITDMRLFVMRPISKAYDVVECYIERNKSGSNKMFPEYCLYMKEGDRFLLTAKKRPKNRTSNYLISLQRGDLLRRGSDNYVGKLRANFLGTEFTIYDNGSNPKDADQETVTSNPGGIRQELGIAMYAANVLGHRGPRKMKVCVPRVRDDGTRVVWRPLNRDDEMVHKCKEQDHTNLTYLINKPPRWNDQVCAYVLNFNGRVTMASVKNFQLVTPEDQETVVLQFGRVGKDLFTMDFRWPLCPLQAFAITLSSFDSKLACE